MKIAARLFALGLIVSIAACSSVSRDSLGIKPSEELPHVCIAPALPTYKNSQYNRELAANDYLVYAIASLSIYADGSKNGFALNELASDWKRISPPEGIAMHGLSYSYYFKEEPDRFNVLVAFRGTEFLDARDWWANLSWFTRIFGVEDEYDYAREAFSRIRKQAIGLAKNRPISIVATGHSLGGGLAQHVTYSFPCTSSVVFNTSPVKNINRVEEPYSNAQVVLIYENNDELTRFKKFIFGDEEIEKYKHYNMQLIPDKSPQHSMEGLAVGMARLVTDCQTRADCIVQRSDLFARRAYCTTYGRYGRDAVCN